MKSLSFTGFVFIPILLREAPSLQKGGRGWYQRVTTASTRLRNVCSGGCHTGPRY